MSRVYSRDGVWYLDYSVHDGERRKRVRQRSHASTRREAERELARLVSLSERAERGSANNSVLLDTVRENFASGLARHAEKTRRDYLTRIDLMLSALSDLEIVRVDQLRPYVIEQALSAITETLSHKSANDALARLKQALNDAVDDRLIESNPIARARSLPKKKVKFRRDFRPEELRVLLEVSPAFWSTLWLFLASTGLRLEEMSWLRWKDVDLKARVLRVQARPGWKPKTKSGEREIPLTEAVTESLRVLPRNGEYVFATQSGNRRRWNVLRNLKEHVGKMLTTLHPNASEKEIDREAASLDVHALRYTFATRLVISGVDVKTAQKLLGHSDVQTTLKIYAQFSDTSAKKAIDNLDLFGTGTNPAQK